MGWSCQLYILKGKTAEGKEFERKHHAWIIDSRNCSYAELMMLNQETGNTSLRDKQGADILFENGELSNRTIGKLRNMTDEEFEQLELIEAE